MDHKVRLVIKKGRKKSGLFLSKFIRILSFTQPFHHAA
ncbi:hypothetical protein LEP1GSC192_2512 [Leptospira sp. B5-022]|nr:hypothetical protein LEP1GSC192_2512 [Leptospira sp. B5-022]